MDKKERCCETIYGFATAFFVFDKGVVMEKVCSFFGHRKIKRTEQLVAQLDDLLRSLIVEKGVITFLFGSRSEFS